MEVPCMDELGCARTYLSSLIGQSLLEKEALTATELRAARAQVNTAPTEAQAEAGNYAKGHVSFKGLDIAIENPKGSTRSGTDKSGKQWSQRMAADYGYFKGIRGKDKDHLDVFIGPNLDSEYVVVINQVDPGTGKLDEHKVLVGCTNEAEARKLYLANYEQGWQGLGSAKPMTLAQFKDWLWKGNLTKAAALKLPELGKAPMQAMEANPHFSEPLTHAGTLLGVDTVKKPKKKSKRKGRRKKKAEDLCTVCKEPWSTCLGRHGSQPCACGSGKPRNQCDCPGGTPDKEKQARFITRYELTACETCGKPMALCQCPDRDFCEGCGWKQSECRCEKEASDNAIKDMSSSESVSLIPELRPKTTFDGGDLSKLKEGDLLDFVIQQHLRSRAGRHYDVRFGNPELGLYSWATRKELPLPGAKTLLSQTPLHAHGYGDFQSQDVRRKRKGQIRVGRTAPGKIHFSTEGENPQQFLMLQPPSLAQRRWLLLNRTPREQFKTAEDWLKEADDAHVPTVAVDLDGTLAKNLPSFDPEKIGPPRKGARKWLRRFRKAGARVIIFTVRGDKQLVKAWLDEHKMPFDFINENPDQPEDASDKVLADLYVDDRGVRADQPWELVGKEVQERLKSAADTLPWTCSPAEALELIWMLRDEIGVA